MSAKSDFVDWLKARHGEIMACERQAYERLDSGDKAGYEAGMREKAAKLRDLHRLALAEGLKKLPAAEADEVERRLSAFSSGGATALSLGSLFYLSALLYRDDHKEGEPDNLAVLISGLESGA